jgi:chromosome segregation ATPase
MHDAQRALSDKEAELAKAMGEVDEQSSFADAQKVEIIALKTQVEALKDRLTAAGNEVRAVEDRREAERVELKAATQELEQERGKVENLGRRVGELEQNLAAQSAEADILGRRANELESRLGEQSRLLTEAEFELKQLRANLEAAHKTENDLRAAIAEIDGRSNSISERLTAEKAQLQAEFERTRDERDRLARELGNMKRETEEAWASERVENALLRERINDVAAEVARLASALEGPNSPIDAILAAETVRDRTTAADTVGEVENGETGNGNLADRIRALQTHASRVTQNDKPN